MKYVYRNTKKSEIAVIGHGTVKPGETIESDTPIHNPNLAPVEQKKKPKQEKD